MSAIPSASKYQESSAPLFGRAIEQDKRSLPATDGSRTRNVRAGDHEIDACSCQGIGRVTFRGPAPRVLSQGAQLCVKRRGWLVLQECLRSLVLGSGRPAKREACDRRADPVVDADNSVGLDPALCVFARLERRRVLHFNLG